MARRAGGAPSVERGTPRHHDEIVTEDKILRAFRGVNVTGPRTGIDDDELYWCENAMPKSNGNLPVVYAAQYKAINYAQALLFETTANIGGLDYIFAFLADGSATYIPDTSTPYVSTQFAAPGTFTAPYAIAYASFAGTPGILIVDPVKGYFDFNITTALTLTNLSNSVSALTLQYAAVFPSFTPVGNVVGGTGSGLSAFANYKVYSGVVTAGGAGYVVGDVLQVQGGTVTTPAQLTVTGAPGGVINAFTITNAGSYPGPATGLARAGIGPPSPATVTGGSGTGATFTLNMICTGYTIVNPGTGYTGTGTIITSTRAGPFTEDYGTGVLSGSLNGTTLAAYAGRVWVGLGKSISFTDINSYNSFGGAGGQLTISDSYLHNAVTVLFASNGFLYIFGDDSIDTLSNVQITGGVTSFSRVNLTTSIGTSYPQSVFAYYRSICFGNKYGFYLLSGATPQKISDGLDDLFNTGALTPVAKAQFVGGLVAGPVTIFGELCMAWTLRIVDGYTTLYGTNVTRTLIVIFFKGKWFFHYPGFDIGQMVSIPVGGVQVLHAFSLTGQVYELFVTDATMLLTFVQTKLWDGGDPLLDKEVIRAGIALNWGANVNQAVTVTTDNEYELEPVPAINDASAALTFINNLGQPLQFQNNTFGNLYFFGGFGSYALFQGASSTTGGKYFGMSVTLQQTDVTISYLAEQFRSTRPW